MKTQNAELSTRIKNVEDKMVTKDEFEERISKLVTKLVPEENW